MAKDYKNRARPPSRRRFPTGRLLITGLFIALFVGFLLFVDRAPRKAEMSLETTPERQTGVDRPAQPNAPESTETPSSSRPRFEFYTLLPEKEVYSPPNGRPQQPSARTPQEQPPVRTQQEQPTTAKPPGLYELQIASLKDPVEADSLRAKLLLLGFDARVQTATVKRQTWHRVRVGPFHGLDQATRAKARLKRNSFESIVVNPKG